MQNEKDPGSGPQLPVGDVPESLTVPYQPAIKAIIVIAALIGLPLLFACIQNDEFVLHLIAVALFVPFVLLLIECLSTEFVTLESYRIVKKRLFLGETAIPAQRVVMTMDQHTIRFYHGSSTNSRERITLRRFMIAREKIDELVSFAEQCYGIQLRQEGGGDETPTYSGNGAGKGRKVNALLLGEFNKAVDSYKLTLYFFAVYAILMMFIVGLSDEFHGIAPELPAFWLRVAAILSAVCGYFLLTRLNPAKGSSDEAASPTSRSKLPWSERFNEVESNSSYSSLVANGVAFVGFILFFLTGNLLDFYLFLAVGAYYYADFFPRLSVWERLSDGTKAPEDTRVPMEPLPSRRRSLQVSLVLMGALAVSSYGESQHYLYKNKKDCLEDWGGNEQDCQEPQGGTTYYRSGHYYGPRYGTAGSRGVRSIGAVTVSRGGFGSLGGFHASFGG